MNGSLRAVAITLSVIASATFAAACSDASGGGLKVGDCIDQPAQGSTASEATQQPCASAHDAEIFAVLTHPAAPNEPYPVSGMDDYVQDACVPLWEAYTDRVWGADTQLAISFLGPTITGWEAGDREVLCYTSKYGGGKLIGSVKDIGSSPLPVATP